MQNSLCPHCQSPIPADAPGGLCPACVLLGVAGPTNPSQAASSAPTIEEVAAAFPELEILGVIGQGGMGVVFKARQPRLDRLVALKILPPALAAQPGFAERFTREARVLARLSHPHIVAVYDFGVSAGFYYLVMEFVHGVNLRAAMRAGVKSEQALLLVPRICEALQFAHDHGVLHRDIKPENILLDTSGTPKLADFGIAKLAGEEAARTGLTATGHALGTAAYMAPEQVEKPATVDHRADIYSLGVVLYEMLTGELPLGRFDAPSEKSSVSRGVDDVVMRALEKERERRQQSATEMKTEVEHATRHGAAQPTGSGESVMPRIFMTLTTLSAVGIPVTAMLGFTAPNPVHMVAFTMVFGALSGLAHTFSPETRAVAGMAGPSTRLIPQKDLGIAYVMWFLFGLIGGHRFYLGQTGWGLLYLVTGGLFFIGWFVDLFTLPAQVRRYNECTPARPPALPRPAAVAGVDPWPNRLFWLVVGLIVLPLAFVFTGFALPQLQAILQDAGARPGGMLNLLVLLVPVVTFAALVIGYQRTKPTAASPAAAVNPWPKRIFILLVVLIGLSGGLITLGILIPVLSYRALDRPAPAEIAVRAGEIQQENVRAAREELERTKMRVEAGVATPLDQLAAVRDLAIAEAGADAVKIAEAQVRYAEQRVAMVQGQVNAGMANASAAREAELALTDARGELTAAQANANVPSNRK